jgi:glycosyltransferase involved in cell wall biosynthesis
MKNKSIVVSRSDADWIKHFRKTGEIDYIQVKWKKRKSSLIGKLDSFLDACQFIKYLIMHRKMINQYKSLIVTGNNVALATLLLRKLRILKNSKVVWWGFFLHSKFSINMYKVLRLFFESKYVVYVLFSYFEESLYEKVFGIRTSTLVLPYGIWNEDIVIPTEEEDYYFAGGYSNRDYIPLIEAFRDSSYKLVIIASKLNVELETIQIPENVKILRDVDKITFHKYMDHSRGVIIPLKNNLGSSGQMVTINAMARGKLIIINDNSIMKEYITNEDSGYVIQDIKKDLINLLEKIERSPMEKNKIKERAHQRYIELYSRQPSIDNTKDILKTINGTS